MKRLIFFGVALVVALLLFTNKVEASIFDPYYHLKEKIESKLEEFYRCVEAEATDGTYEQKINVASCILNRVKSKEWPNTIHEVIFQKGQFAVISDKRFWSVRVTNETKEACWESLLHGCTHNCQFFCTPYAGTHSSFFKNKKPSFYDGMHNYYR